MHFSDELTESWVEEVLRFANLENAEDLQTVSDDDAETDLFEPDELLSGELFYTAIVGGAEGEYENSQARLREVLDMLIADGETPGVHKLISDKIGNVEVSGHVVFQEGFLRFRPLAHIKSNDQWWAIGVAKLLHSGMGDRLRQCGWEKCARYFVDWPGRKGQSKLYCCSDHQNAERQRRHREKQRKRRKQQLANQSIGN